MGYLVSTTRCDQHILVHSKPHRYYLYWTKCCLIQHYTSHSLFCEGPHNHKHLLKTLLKKSSQIFVKLESPIPKTKAFKIYKQGARKVPVMIDPSVSLVYVAEAVFHSSSLVAIILHEACSRIKKTSLAWREPIYEMVMLYEKLLICTSIGVLFLFLFLLM